MKFPVLALAMLLALTGLAQPQSASNGNIDVVSPWARATAAGSPTGGAYLMIVNKGSSDDRLLSVSSPVTGMAELHRTENDNGVMKMLPVAAIEVKAGQKIELAPGGYHIMLMNLKAPLTEGESFPLSLIFEKAGKIDVMVKVGKAGAMDSGDMPGMNMN